jgi:hypothetical protein
MKNLRKESLLVRNEVIKLLKDNFDIEFVAGFNDLYKRKNNLEVRRIKGYIESCMTIICDENNVVVDVKTNILKRETLAIYNKFLSDYYLNTEFKVNINYLEDVENTFKFVIFITYSSEN